MAAFTATQVPARVQARPCTQCHRAVHGRSPRPALPGLGCLQAYPPAPLTHTRPVALTAHQARAVASRRVVTVRASAAPESSRRAFAAAVFGGAFLLGCGTSFPGLPDARTLPRSAALPPLATTGASLLAMTPAARALTAAQKALEEAEDSSAAEKFFSAEQRAKELAADAARAKIAAEKEKEFKDRVAKENKEADGARPSHRQLSCWPHTARAVSFQAPATDATSACPCPPPAEFAAALGRGKGKK